jgi:hypothetical protein
MRILSWTSSIIGGMPEIHDVSGGPGSVVGIAGRRALDGPVFGGGKRFSILHTRRERLRGPRNLQFNIYRIHFPGGKPARAWR